MALEPITRQEQIVAGKKLKPITRMEKFLKDYGVSNYFGTETKMVEGDTLTWDGNTEGLVCVDTGDSQFYLVADNVITLDDLKGGVTIIDSYGDSSTVTYSEIEEVFPMFGGALPLHESCAFLIPTDNFVFMDAFTFPKAGIYFRKDEYSRIVSLTIPGYTGFVSKQTVVKPLAEQYMPILTSPSGKKFKLSVDDSGAVTATEV